MSKVDIVKKKLIVLVDEINNQNLSGKVKFNQQKVIARNMSISGANGRIYINPVGSEYDVSLLRKSLEKNAGKSLEELFNKSHDGYKHAAKEYQPYWRTDNFELVKKAVYIYSKTTK